MLSRRQAIAAAGAAALGSACRPHRADVVRLGFMTNTTHAPMIAGIASGRIERAIGVRVESRSFRAGPRVIEALMGDAIDAGTSGPAPVVYTHARHGTGALHVLAGCASGGASFIVGRNSGIAGPQDLRGRTLATVQIGTTQDISLRTYLRKNGYSPAERGGDVTVHALDAATVLTEMRVGHLDGAWLPEPWATRVVRDAGAVRLVDERDLWPARAFPTAILVSRGDWAHGQPAVAARLADALGAEVDRARAQPAETRALVGDELARLLGKRLPAALIEASWPFVDYTRDPLPDALDTIAADAFALGLAPQTTCRGLFT